MIVLFGLKQVRGAVHRRKDVSVSRCHVRNPLHYFQVKFPTDLVFSTGFIQNSQFLKPTLLSLMEVNSRKVLTEFSNHRDQ